MIRVPNSNYQPLVSTSCNRKDNLVTPEPPGAFGQRSTELRSMLSVLIKRRLR